MEEQYVISIKVRKNINEDKSEGWLYAGSYYNKHYKKEDPCWKFTQNMGINFKSIEEAKEWFKKSKSYLLGSYYKDNYDLDIETLGIWRVLYMKVESLE